MSKFCAPRLILLTAFFLASSFMDLPESFAQSQATGASAAVAPRMYDSAKEVVLTGTISEVVARPKAGLPLGLHVMVSTAQGQVDVHLGPFWARLAGQKGLVPGATIRVTGANSNFPSGDVFLARLVVVGNETLTIRNPNGIPVRVTPGTGRTVRGSQPAGGQ